MSAPKAGRVRAILGDIGRRAYRRGNIVGSQGVGAFSWCRHVVVRIHLDNAVLLDIWVGLSEFSFEVVVIPIFFLIPQPHEPHFWQRVSDLFEGR